MNASWGRDISSNSGMEALGEGPYPYLGCRTSGAVPIPEDRVISRCSSHYYKCTNNVIV